jgi:hypothetical protein
VITAGQTVVRPDEQVNVVTGAGGAGQ